ncbi:MAG: carbon storage regulator CsrA [Deltaproteobacteria bacterium]|nr:carbon storage regulator CsrA [Deltaproteobacteria bacterium]
MLILTRKIGETVTIGDEIKVQVVDVKGRQVRLGITAPAEWAVHREEIFIKIQEQNLQSLRTDASDLQSAAQLLDSVKPGARRE